MTTLWSLTLRSEVNALSLPKNVICTVKHAPVNSPTVLVRPVLAIRIRARGLREFLSTRLVNLPLCLECRFIMTCDGRRPLRRVPFLCRNLGVKMTPLIRSRLDIWLANLIGTADPTMTAVLGLTSWIRLTIVLIESALKKPVIGLQLAGAVMTMK